MKSYAAEAGELLNEYGRVKFSLRAHFLRLFLDFHAVMSQRMDRTAIVLFVAPALVVARAIGQPKTSSTTSAAAFRV
jgi:hypothetical protein